MDLTVEIKLHTADQFAWKNLLEPYMYHICTTVYHQIFIFFGEESEKEGWLGERIFNLIKGHNRHVGIANSLIAKL